MEDLKADEVFDNVTDHIRAGSVWSCPNKEEVEIGLYQSETQSIRVSIKRLESRDIS